MLLGEYLIRRLQQLGITTIFGVPGDFELPLLDQIPPQQWSGSPNELIAAYSADGYARMKGFGALVTTFGPGETSAICGTAGSYCESVAVLHIVGYPGVRAQTKGKILHHTLGDLKYDITQYTAEVTCAATILKNAEEAPDEIDKIIKAMIHHNRPAYLGFPVDLQTTKISTAQLNVPLPQSLNMKEDNDLNDCKELAFTITDKIQNSRAPIIISDGGATRNNIEPLIQELGDMLLCPMFTTFMGKGSVDEQSPLFCGVYGGKGSLPDTIKTVEGSDCVLWVGNFPSDFNTGGFSENVAPENIIDFQRFEVKIGHEKHSANIKAIFMELIKQIKDRNLTAKYESNLSCIAYPEYKESEAEEITHKWLWQRFSSFLRSSDILITETGCSQAGMMEARFPSGIKMFTQAIFGSIGFAPGAAVGASIAGKELNGQGEKYKRMVLVEGDGSLQLTVQALSVLQREGLIPVIYTVERLIHGLHAPYNKIYSWNYTALLKVLAPDIESRSYHVSTAKELDELMKDKEFNEATCPQLVEVMMDEYDCPNSVQIIGETAARHNAG
ncbi:hypothetical protein HYALB_00007465 [Hymenoscyphus albidus]|uniref:Pyruvate decarboxylase n=1 Tax=Hymenoscyphus albidus TaxID=595503 RepID=A0A9N9Q407_9HELO|nr:hypothetical protein HYALB_00007465 [Hymenoscyphus albidus]